MWRWASTLGLVATAPLVGIALSAFPDLLVMTSRQSDESGGYALVVAFVLLVLWGLWAWTVRSAHDPRPGAVYLTVCGLLVVAGLFWPAIYGLFSNL